MVGLCKILIVDDEYLLRQGIKHLLDWEKEGFQIVGEASNGKEALDLIEKLQPHIVISDIVMPIMDGVDLTKIIKSRFPKIQVLILSSYSDFEYVKDTFKHGVNDYILKPTLDPQELLSLLKTTIKNIPDLVFLNSNGHKDTSINMVINRLLAGFDISKNKELIKNTFINDTFCLLGTNIKKITGEGTNILSLSKSQLSDLVKDSLKNVVYYEINENNYEFLILINFNIKDFHHTLNHVKNMIYNVLDNIPEIFFVLSKPFNDIYHLKDIYTNSYKPLFGYKFYFKNKPLISYDDIGNNNCKYRFDFKHYSDEIYMLNINAALNYLKTYLKSCISNFSINEFELKTLFQNALYNIISILDDLNFNMVSIDESKREYFQKIDETKNPEELLSFLDIITNQLNETLNNQQNSLNNHMIHNILDYITDHYNEQLSLKQLADEFHFNYYYLSSYFSYHNKEGFSEYLNKIRVEKAAELLRNETIPVSEISYMVGYSDHSYFCKVFKKLKNATPSKFRKNILNKRGSYV